MAAKNTKNAGRMPALPGDFLDPAAGANAALQDARAPRGFPPGIQLQGLFAPESIFLNEVLILTGKMSRISRAFFSFSYSYFQIFLCLLAFFAGKFEPDTYYF
jgi:hypothetical protein